MPHRYCILSSGRSVSVSPSGPMCKACGVGIVHTSHPQSQMPVRHASLVARAEQDFFFLSFLFPPHDKAGDKHSRKHLADAAISICWNGEDAAVQLLLWHQVLSPRLEGPAQARDPPSMSIGQRRGRRVAHASVQQGGERRGAGLCQRGARRQCVTRCSTGGAQARRGQMPSCSGRTCWCRGAGGRGSRAAGRGRGRPRRPAARPRLRR